MPYRVVCWMLAAPVLFAAAIDESGRVVMPGGLHFTPRFTVLRATEDPKLALRRDEASKRQDSRYSVATWTVPASFWTPAAALARSGKPPTEAGDGFDDRILKGSVEHRTPDLFRAAPSVTVTCAPESRRGQTVRWTCPEQEHFRLSADVDASGDFPTITLRFTPKSAGYYSVGYTGAPEIDPSAADEFWQPLIWQEKRFPIRSYLTMAFHCPIPATLVRRNGISSGVAADSAEFPFDPLPTQYNNRFGVALRNASGKAQSMLFAPVLGGPESKMAAGAGYSFRLRLIAQQGACDRVFETAARRLYGFRDVRRNGTHTLNQTLDNMIGYGLSQWSWFIDELKGPSYETDVPGAVKNVSSLHPLAVALATGEPEIYWKRALPILEFILSRGNLLFSLNPKQGGQTPTRDLTGPCARPSELTVLYGITGGEAFRKLATRKMTADKHWFDPFVKLQAGAASLDGARDSALSYVQRRVATPQTDYTDPDSGGSSFWTGFAPDWMKLTEAYEATGDKRLLEAAVRGARLYAMYTWLTPQIPDGSITVNRGGKAPMYWYLEGKGHLPLELPEETVPAWRLSEHGLTCEAAATSAGHRGIMLANHAPWMLRLAHYSGDKLLHDVGRSAVVGRYANFPGYHINTARTTAYEKPDYPLRPHKNLSVNSFHYNHIWPQMALVMDYLVTDAFTRSKGAVSFPSRYAEGYAYLQSKIYGDRPGKFYGDEGVWLWMPRGLVQKTGLQLNYVAGRGPSALYLAFTNQSSEPVRSVVRLDPKIASGNYPGRIWRENRAVGSFAVRNGSFTIEVAPRGITAVKIEGVRAASAFRIGAVQPWSRDYTEMKFGKARAMIIPMGEAATTAYVYLQATDRDYRSVKLHYRTGAEWRSEEDAKFPFEFRVDVKGASRFEYRLEAVTAAGQTVASDTDELRR